MRILRLRFKNLNSLVGEWVIDFTDPAYLDHGIFAITGPTGAGKSTILDAICVALYGRTPRLGRLTASHNPLMSQQTGDCFAEVEFETAAGRYRCLWSQHRARHRPGGALQVPKRELADADSGRLIGDTQAVQAVNERIERLTGMDFERFTRSMLLAQGRFAAFLDAPPDQRAPILEQITGTGIYSEISKRVHLRCRDEKRHLVQLEEALAGLTLLDPALRDELQQRLGEQQRRIDETERAIEEVAAGLAWLDALETARKALAEHQRRWRQWQQRDEAFDSERERLALARRAAHIAGTYDRLTGLRAGIERQRRLRDDTAAALDALSGQYAKAKRADSEAADGVRAAERALADRTPGIRRARELDRRLSAIAEQLAVREQQRDEARDALAAAEVAADQVRTVLAEKRTAHRNTQQWLEAHAGDGGLVGTLDALTDQAVGVRDLLREQAARKARLAEIESDLRAAQTAHRQAVEQRGSAAATLAVRRESSEAEQRRLDTLLAGESLEQWVERQGRQVQALGRIESLIDAVARTGRIEVSHEEWAAKEAAASAKLEACRRQLEALHSQKPLAEQDVARLEEILLLEQRIESLEAARRDLRDGEPCPLCGSREHPWAGEAAPGGRDAAARLEKARQTQRNLLKRIAGLERDVAGSEKDLAHARERRAELESEIAEARAALESGMVELGAEGEDDPAAWLQSRRAELEAEQAETGAVLAEARAALARLEAHRAELKALETSLRQVEAAIAQAETERRLLDEARQSQLGQIQGLEERFSAAWERLQRALTDHGIELGAVEDLDRALDTLTRRREAWLKRRDEVERLIREIGTLEARFDHAREDLQRLEGELQRAESAVEAVRRETAQVTAERHDAFGDADPDAVEETLQKALAEAVDEHRRCREQWQRRQLERQQLVGRLDGIDAEIRRLEKAQAQAEADFDVGLAEAGFRDETTFLDARLDGARLDALADRDAGLQREKAALLAERERLEAQLKTLERAAVTNEPAEVLQKRQTELRQTLAELHRQAGAWRERLEQDAALREKRARQVAAIDAQRKALERWETLDTLIGSSDGKIYRNFAQGLTFELMLAQANRQLQRMTDRYLLVPDDDQPLALNVIDNYQAGEVRPVATLSGGESFIVSLALALGLSGMASRNVRVDSLFLDEGFGSLDDEALETALETLSGLHREGKLIGVISHVAALKERIPVQIAVIPKNGGCSVLKGPGCSGA